MALEPMPIAVGFVLGIAMGAAPRHLRHLLAISLVAGALLAVITGEIAVSSAYILFDALQVSVALMAGYALSRRRTLTQRRS